MFKRDTESEIENETFK